MLIEFPIKILLVEDDEEDQFIMQDFLQDSALMKELVCVRNFNQFLSLVNSNFSFDLVITDYLLGGTSGLEVLKKVKEFNPLIPVMILTGKGNTAIDFEAMKLGASDYLIKGNFDQSILERSIRYAIERSNSIKIIKENEHYVHTINRLVSTDRMARMIAHEVKNPLTNILLCTDQLRSTFQQNQEVISFIDLIVRNSNRINKLVSDLLDSTRFGDIKLEKRNLVNVVRDTISIATDRINLQAIELIEYYSDEEIEMSLDEEKLKFAVLNIITNAIEALEEMHAGIIEVKVVKIANRIKIHITDNGPGMTHETMEKLFEPFYTSKVNGSGLGLSSAQNIVLGHKGIIEVKSEPNRGSEFILSFF